METTQIYVLYMHFYTFKTHKKGSQYRHFRREPFHVKCTRNNLRLLEFQKYLRGECSQNLLAAYAVVHIKNMRKELQYKHVRKEPFCLKMHQKIISNCYNFKNLLGDNAPRSPNFTCTCTHKKNAKGSQYKHIRKGAFVPEYSP